MAIFSGKIIEAYYSDPNSTTIEVIYKEGEKAVNHYLKVNHSHPDFQDLIKEYDLEKIQLTTNKRIASYKEQINKIVGNLKDDLVSQNEAIKNAHSSFFNIILGFDEKQKEHLDFLFTLKLKIFENKKVVDSKNDEVKANIRKSINPIDVLKEFNKI
jgi:predicted transcriptional regulator